MLLSHAVNGKTYAPPTRGGAQRKDAMEPRYAALAREIARDIGSGQHPVGSLLPAEVELAELHGVSRATVRSALQQLEALGLISRRKRVGTRVEAARPVTGYAAPS